MLSSLHAQFLRERKYLKNLTPKSIQWHHYAFGYLVRFTSATTPADLTRSVLTEFVVTLRERGWKTVSINTRCRSINAFLRWLHAEGHLPTLIPIPKLKEEKTVIRTLSGAEQKRLVGFRPKCWTQRRAHTLALLLIDAGLRIDEALGLRPQDVNFDDLLLRVMGKGRKERLVPMSIELRRVLFRWLTGQRREWVFTARDGSRLKQRNALRSHYAMLRQAGVPKCGFHRLRHCFATEYLKHGGEIVRLSRILGHSQIETTMRYLHMLTADLQQPHQQLSVLNRLR